MCVVEISAIFKTFLQLFLMTTNVSVATSANLLNYILLCNVMHPAMPYLCEPPLHQTTPRSRSHEAESARG